jgi:hypothetical protein
VPGLPWPLRIYNLVHEPTNDCPTLVNARYPWCSQSNISILILQSLGSSQIIAGEQVKNDPSTRTASRPAGVDTSQAPSSMHSI